MSFKEDFQNHISQVNLRKLHISNEESTKQALIIPFIQVLGYDVFNPLEVKPEFVADFGYKKGEKVDYAVLKDNVPIMFIEAKSITEKLENHDAQLSRYFNSTPGVKLGILTNGIRYKFFTDLNQNNIMDSTPFFDISLENITDTQIDTLQQFKKDFFSSNRIISFAEELVYMSNLNKNLKELFKNPSDEFIRFLIKDFTESKITASVIERFRPLVKKSITSALLEIVSQGIQFEDVKDEAAATRIIEDIIESDTKSKIVTSEAELKSFDLIINILSSANKDVSDVKYKDTVTYFGIYKKNIYGWFLRLNLETNLKYIITKLPIDTARELATGYTVEAAPKSMGESRVLINGYEDINNLHGLIIKCYDFLD